MFSMSFFKWVPEESSRMISPWVVLYFGSTILVTGLLFWLSQKWRTKEEADINELVWKELNSENSSLV